MSNSSLTGRKTKDEELSFRLKLKKYKMLFFYYFKKSRGKFSLAYILFAINLFLFSLILIPNLANRSPIPLGTWPIMLELRGTVLLEINSPSNETNLIPASGVEIRIGGYYTTSDYNGSFSISFTSQTYTDIAIVFRWSNKTIVRWTSFQQGQFEKDEVFVIK